MRHKRLIALFLILNILLASGCWDMIEIEKRAFISGISIDIIEKSEESEGGKEGNFFCEENPKRIMVTFGIINPSKLQEGGEGGIVRQSVEAANIPDAMEKLGERISRVPFYGHTRLLMFSEKLVMDKELFKEIVDEFERKAIINQQMKILVYRGKFDDITKVDPKLENIQPAYITGILDNSKVLSNTASISLHELIAGLRNNDGSTAIPLLESKVGKESEFTINKLALMKDYKLLKILDSKYIKTYKLLNGDFSNGRKLVNYKGIIVPFYIFTAQKRTWLESGGEGLKFRVKVMLEGDIEQFEFGKILFDPKVISDVEKSIDEFTIKELNATTKYFQKDIESDYLGFKEYTNKYHYKVFKKYEDNWDEAFINAEIIYEVEAKIRRIGTSRE